MNTYKTEQEAFWAGDFGNEYIQRNQDEWLLASNTSLFSTLFKRTRNVHSIIELGANIGMNLHAIRRLLPDAQLAAVEINEEAARELRKISDLSVYNQSLLEFTPEKTYDFVFTKGVLIHIEPAMLQKTYTVMYETSNRYIALAEYYNPTPMEIPYREFREKMYKRDFAGELMDMYPDLELVDYGFVYRRDPVFMQGDLTWFLLEKRGN